MININFKKSTKHEASTPSAPKKIIAKNGIDILLKTKLNNTQILTYLMRKICWAGNGTRLG